MPDVYATIEAADEAVQERLAEVLELRAADPAQQAMRRLRDHHTLFDENAAAHIAWGRAIPWALDHLPADEHATAGLNESATHTDFMVGGLEVEIDGVQAGGGAVALLRGGEWQLGG